jgi:hypothetical protein
MSLSPLLFSHSLGGRSDRSFGGRTALQWWDRQREAMPLRWSLADPVASVAINMALPKELLALSACGTRNIRVRARPGRPRRPP